MALNQKQVQMVIQLMELARTLSDAQKVHTH